MSHLEFLISGHPELVFTVSWKNTIFPSLKLCSWLISIWKTHNPSWKSQKSTYQASTIQHWGTSLSKSSKMKVFSLRTWPKTSTTLRQRQESVLKNCCKPMVMPDPHTVQNATSKPRLSFGKNTCKNCRSWSV